MTNKSSQSKQSLIDSADVVVEWEQETNQKRINEMTTIDTKLTEKAVTALFKYHTDHIDPSKTLLGSDDKIRVQFALEQITSKSLQKPIPIKIPYPLHKVFRGELDNNNKNNVDVKHDDDDDTDELEEAEICVFVKNDETKKIIQELINEFPNSYMKSIKKIMTLQSLRTKHNEFKNKRDLIHKYTFFLADDRILPMLREPLGKIFYKVKKQPVPVQVSNKEKIPSSIYKALSSTFLTITRGGNCISILAGTTNMSIPKVVANIHSIVQTSVPKMPQGWANIRCIGIKLTKSTELPIYNKSPEQLMEIAKLAGIKPHFQQPIVNDQSEANNKNIANNDNDTNNEKQQQVQNKKRELDKKKSPLLRAIKKQKQLEEEGNEKQKSSNTTSGHTNSKTTTLPTKNNNESKGTTKDGATVPLSSTTKKTKTMKHNDNEDKAEKTKVSAKKEKESTESAVTTAKETPTKVTTNVKTKEPVEPTEKKQLQQQQQQQESGPFIPSTKYVGSKKGYVYKKDKLGLGYYLDRPPVVDPMVLDAFIRLGQQQNNRNKNNTNKNNSKGGSKDNRRHSFGTKHQRKGGNSNNNNNKNRRKSR